MAANTNSVPELKEYTLGVPAYLREYMESIQAKQSAPAEIPESPLQVALSNVRLQRTNRAPYVSFAVELYAIEQGEALPLLHSAGWRFINGYISPPMFKGSSGFKSLTRLGESVMRLLWQEIAAAYPVWQKELADLPALKDFKKATGESRIIEER